MSESFADLLKESENSLDLSSGAIIDAEIVDIDKDWVTVNAGLKSEDQIPVAHFLNESGELSVVVGDSVKVALEAAENGFGETKFSREKAKRAEVWVVLDEAFEKSDVVTGIINGKVKGGYTVDLNSIRAFLPGSLIDMRPLRDTTHLEGKPLEFKIIKLDQKRNNVVVSRRAVLEDENSVEREELLDNLQEGQSVKGVVKNLTDYGAFVDLGGVDGLLHITDIAWKRIRHPSEMLEMGDEITVKVLKFDRERCRVSLGLKQLGEDPWALIVERYPVNTRTVAKVTNLTDYGCFAEIEEGVEGLVHVSEMDWTNKNIHPSKVVQVGDEVEVMVLDINEDKRRISLGIKQCAENPWQSFAGTVNKGDKVSGKIKSITDFGVFIGLDGGIDGLVHLSDLSWNEEPEVAVRNFKKGDEVEAIVLGVDPERERISLGIKQLVQDSFSDYVNSSEKGAIVTGTVAEISPKQAIVKLDEDVEAILKASEWSRDRVEDLNNVLKVGDEVEAKIISVDRKNRIVSLSVKAKDLDEEKEVMKELRRKDESAGSTTLGDLLKAKLGEKE